jgi:hypothetical protein
MVVVSQQITESLQKIQHTCLGALSRQPYIEGTVSVLCTFEYSYSLFLKDARRYEGLGSQICG